MRFVAIVMGLLALSAASAARAQSDIFIVKSASKDPDAVVTAIKSYSERKKWQYLGDSKIKQGEVTLVKICIPAVGQALWAAGLQLSAMLPCGNIGIYRNGAATEISVLHPRYMQMLFPHAATERATALALPLLTEMLDDVTK